MLRQFHADQKFYKKLFPGFLATFLCLVFITMPALQTKAENKERLLGKLQVEKGQFWKVKKPESWIVHTAPGHCNMFAMIIQDPQNTERMILFYGAIGPLTMSYLQHNLDLQDYKRKKLNYPQLYYPVIEPWELKTLLEKWPEIKKSPVGSEQFLPATPEMKGMTVVDQKPVTTPFTEHGAQSFAARGTFLSPDEKKAAQGLFTATLIQQQPYNNKPNMHFGTAYVLAGVTAEINEFDKLLPELSEILGSIRLESSYVEACASQVQGTYAPMLYASKNMSSVGRMLQSFWSQQMFRQDIAAQIAADKVLNKARMYDPMTFETYLVDVNFVEEYLSSPTAYENPGLKPVSNVRHDLWIKLPKDQSEIKKKEE